MLGTMVPALPCSQKPDVTQAYSLILPLLSPTDVPHGVSVPDAVFSSQSRRAPSLPCHLGASGQSVPPQDPCLVDRQGVCMGVHAAGRGCAECPASVGFAPAQ
ncbi:Hypothetical predicted protein [Marmota monax]|uniref:Uncharacterized protein n=1 Tax=Marmota monax TaxID=9995 RepID=A0A5E4AIE2_MARMO|nr:hypothetical protein GHT09_006199 [Marmota monax]VTJ56561.1 Hypothetical predicted protein [Marmota monax]